MNHSRSLQRASAAALRLLSYRPRSQAEIRAHLERRFAPDVVEQVMADLVEHALVDDSKFAKLWSDSRDSLNPRSAFAIKRELISKGVATEAAEAAVRDIDDQDSAYRAGRKLVRRLGGTDYATFHRRLLDYLRRRGFSYSVARHTAARLWDERQGTTPASSGAAKES